MIRRTIFEHLPKEAELTRIEFEGPSLAIYTKKPEIRVTQSKAITEIVNLIKKRIVIRSDPSVRMAEPEAQKTITEIVTQEAEVTNVLFDPTVGEVIIEAKKPGLVIGKDGSTLNEIVVKTRWIPRVLRSPPKPSKIIAHVRHSLYSGSKERERILRNVGERIYRPLLHEVGDVRITMLGAAREVGRSAILVETRESQVLIDCGINPGSTKPFEVFPRFDVAQFDPSTLDAVVISHAHLDHCGFLPFLFKYGFDGPVYCSVPNLSLMTLLQLDYLDVMSKQGLPLFYDQKDVRESVLHTVPLRFGVVTDIAPDIRLTLHNAGHILGSSIVHLHMGEGYHNIVYTGDFKFGKTMLLEAAARDFPRVETIITEATYSGPTDIMPAREEAEQRLTQIINETLTRSGKVLIPVPAVGRAQEIMLILDEYMKRGMMKEAPVFIEGMISEATAIHTAHPEYLSREVRNSILNEGVNPFESDYFTVVEHPSARQDIINGEPSIIVATAGMLEGGPIIDYFQQLAEDSRNTIIFVSYQIEGTLGRRVQKKVPEVSVFNSEGKIKVIKCNLEVQTVDGFSGHSDRRQIIGYIRKLASKPENVIVCHGEKSKCLGLADYLRTRYKINATAPDVLETIRLH
ncbi:beta-CASP ribonuclease aCPSF1 [Candidatus Bathyarchaeota archaeon]|nr:beta-CASP ribonuclease aCPSF1 [Candidatus Bathyarchaeota archaeon]